MRAIVPCNENKDRYACIELKQSNYRRQHVDLAAEYKTTKINTKGTVKQYTRVITILKFYYIGEYILQLRYDAGF